MSVLLFICKAFFDCQSDARPVLPGSRGVLKGVGVFSVDHPPLWDGSVNYFVWSRFSRPFMFFVEGSILAQDERWRRA